MTITEIGKNVGLSTVGFVLGSALEKKIVPEKFQKFVPYACIAGGAALAWKVKNPFIQSIGGGIAVYGVIKVVSNLTEKMPSVQAFLPTLGSVETPRIFGLEDTHQSTQAVNGFHEQDGVNGFDGHEDVNGFDGHEDVNGFDGHEDVNGFDGHEDVNGFDGHEDVNGIDGWFDMFKKTRKPQAAQLAVARRMPRQQANQSVARPTPRAFSSIFGKFKPTGSLF